MTRPWTLPVIDPGSVISTVPDEKAYNRYRKSAAWQKIRARVIGTARGRCRGNAAREVHHRDYSPRVLAGRDDAALVALCTNCHRTIHFTADGTKRVSWHDRERVLAELVAGNTLPA